MDVLHAASRSATVLTIFMSAPGPAAALDAGGPSAELFAGAPALSQGMVMTSKSSLLALSFNPAGLADVKGPQLSVGLTPGVAALKRSGPNSEEDRFNKVLIQTPNLYVGSPFDSERWYWGLSITAASGFGTDWSTTGSSRYFSTDSQLGTIRFNPTVALKASPRVRLGFGVAYLLGTADLQSQLNVTALNFALGGDPAPDPDGTARIKFRGDSWGYNFGILFHPSERYSLGASYRSRFNTRFKGSLKFSGLKDESAGVFGGSTYSTDIESVLPFPEIVALGLTYRPTPQLDLSVDAQWAQWAVFRQLKTDFTEETDPNRLAVLNFGNPIPTRWEDVYSFGFGLEHRSREYLRLRAGLYSAPTPVPKSTFGPLMPFLDRVGLTFGAGYDWRRNLTLDVGAAAVFHRNRKVDNSVGDPVASADGKYESFFGILGVNLTYRL